MTRGTTWEGVEYLVATKVKISIALPAWPLGSGETSWNIQKIGAEPDLVAFHI